MRCLRILTRMSVCLLSVLGPVACSSYFPEITNSPAEYGPLDYYQWLQSADAETLAQEQERLSQNDSVRGKVQVAMFARFQKEAPEQVFMLLKDAWEACDAVEAGETGRYCLAAKLLLPGSEVEQAQIQNLAQALAQEMTQSMEQELASSQAEQEAMRQEIDRLQEQLEALTNLEQQLIEREQSQQSQQTQQLQPQVNQANEQ